MVQYTIAPEGSYTMSNSLFWTATLGTGDHWVDVSNTATIHPNNLVVVKYTRRLSDQDWVRFATYDGGTNATAVGGGPVSVRLASASTTTIFKWSWGLDQVEVEQEWRGAYDPQSGWIPFAPWPAKTPAERLREIIQSRFAPAFIKDRKMLNLSPADIREIRARETLCRVIGEEKFRTFLLRGHLTVRGKSGLNYQIFPGHGITNVYDKGKMVDRLCVVLKGDFPPTDSVIVRYLMLLNNEEQFKSHAIRHRVQENQWPEIKEMVNKSPKSLVEIYRDLKKRAA